MRPVSPLRYPGGKSCLTKLIASIIEKNGLLGCNFAEPFAGGGGAAIGLLAGEYVDRIFLNDLDPAIYSVWVNSLHETDAFVDWLNTVPVSVHEWDRQKAIYSSLRDRACFELGCASFYLNRCNRSGIIHNGGIIGGRSQRSRWGIDARFNKSELARRIDALASYGDRIVLSRLDAREFIDFAQAHNRSSNNHRTFLFIDPPYVQMGGSLYLNNLDTCDHEEIAHAISSLDGMPWIVTYDDHDLIRELYADHNIEEVPIGYSAGTRSIGTELLITPRYLAV